MRLFVPAFDALWKGAKASLHNSTRAIFLKLCQEARDAERGGAIVLPRARDDVDAIALLCPGPRDEMDLALKEMTDPGDPMIAVGDQDGRRVLRILSWEGWALVGTQRSSSEPEATSPTRSPAAVRAARYRANRKTHGERDASRDGERDASRDGDRNHLDLHVNPPPSERNGGVTRPPIPSRSGRDGERDGGVTVGGGKGGATPPDQKREDLKRSEDTRSQKPTPQTPLPAAGGLPERGRKGGRTASPEKLAKAKYPSAWAQGISMVTGHPCTTPPGSEFGRIAAAHALSSDKIPLTGDDLLTWFRSTAADFARHVATLPAAKRKLTVHEYRLWLDNGGAAPTAHQSATTQGGKAEGFRDYWLKSYKSARSADYVEAEGEVNHESYRNFMAIAETQARAVGGDASDKRWAKHWVDSYLADHDPFFAKSGHSFATLLWAVREQPARWGIPDKPPPRSVSAPAIKRPGDVRQRDVDENKVADV